MLSHRKFLADGAVGGVALFTPAIAHTSRQRGRPIANARTHFCTTRLGLSGAAREGIRRARSLRQQTGNGFRSLGATVACGK
jgi:hypothetical protein